MSFGEEGSRASMRGGRDRRPEGVSDSDPARRRDKAAVHMSGNECKSGDVVENESTSGSPDPIENR